jgi:hypothetical protein
MQKIFIDIAGMGSFDGFKDFNATHLTPIKIDENLWNELTLAQ